MKTYLKLLLIGITSGVLAFTMFSIDKAVIVGMLNQYNLLPKSELYTELYFEDHKNLFKPIDRNRGKIFRFTVHNLENRSFTYNYIVKATSSQSAYLLDKGSFTLSSNGSTTITEKISTNEANLRTKVSVTLVNKDQSIHFWIN